jgi:hypothetical protein
MAKILIVHGIGNQFAGEMELRGAWYRALCDGLLRAGFSPLPAEAECYCPFYGDLFRPGAALGGGAALDFDSVEAADDDEAALVEAIWRAAAAMDAAVPAPEEYGDTLFRSPRLLERALNSLSRSAFLANAVPLQFFGDLKQVVRYFRDPGLRAEILDRVTSHIGPETRLVIGHSLGSVVAYEALCARPEGATAFLTLGSPLGLRNVVFDKLTPRPGAAGIGAWPGGVAEWTNVAARGDIVAAQKELAPCFGNRVVDVLIDSGWDAHSSARYLNSLQAGTAVARALRA